MTTTEEKKKKKKKEKRKPNINNKFKQLEELRLKGYSKKQAADLLGLTRAAITHYYSGSSDPECKALNSQWTTDPGWRFNGRPQDRGKQPFKIVVYSTTQLDESNHLVKLAEGTFKECAKQLSVKFNTLQQAYKRGSKKYIIRRIG